VPVLPLRRAAGFTVGPMIDWTDTRNKHEQHHQVRQAGLHDPRWTGATTRAKTFSVAAFPPDVPANLLRSVSERTRLSNHTCLVPPRADARSVNLNVVP
jgi:hypothetical protein